MGRSHDVGGSQQGGAAVRVLVTGGAGFIGSNFVRLALAEKTEWSITVLDKLTYAGNRANLTDCEATGRVRFVHGDICDGPLLADLVPGHDVIFNFAAESHVDRSIHDAVDFVRTDVEGTRALLEAARLAGAGRYVQISTDEVYGDLPGDERATPDSPLRPRSPYSASKAAGDLMVQAYRATYGLETIITRCSNNYGPFQYPEKLISLFTTNALDGKPLPLYGDGRQQRDWIHVLDHCAALLVVLERGTPGRIYNIGTEVERVNIDVVHSILAATGRDATSIRFVDDRKGHDRRYALDATSTRELGWSSRTAFDRGLAETVEWYRANPGWWRPLRDRAFQSYYTRQYGSLEAVSAGGSNEA